MQSGDSLGTANTCALDEKLKSESRLIYGDGHSPQGPLVLFGVGLPAVLAAEALQAIPMPTKTLAGFLTTRAIHDRGFRFSVYHDLSIQQALAVCQDTSTRGNQKAGGNEF